MPKDLRLIAGAIPKYALLAHAGVELTGAPIKKLPRNKWEGTRALARGGCPFMPQAFLLTRA